MKLNILPARQGILWVKLGVKTFLRQPLALAGLFFIFMLLMSVLSMVPVLGNALALALLPAATLGLMAATQEAAKGKFPMPTVLMVAFRAGQQRFKAMLVLGMLYALSFLTVMALTTLVDGGSFAKVYLANAPITPEVVEAGDFQMAVWLSTVLYIPMSMMFWHAPALVHWHGVPPVKSMFFSAIACWRNLTAFAVYLLAWAGFFVIGATVILTISSALGGNDLTAAVLMPGALLMSAMFFTSVYFSVKDCFDLPSPGSETQA